MAVTGKFLADFSEFTSAVQGAVSDLLGLEAAADDSAKAMDDLGDPGPVKETTAATEELGGATAATGDLFGALQGKIAGAMTVGAVLAFMSSVMDLAGEVARLSEATGLSTDEIQRLMAVSNATSIPIETLAKASGNLTLAVGNRSTGLVGALAELGISFEEFKGLSAGDQFETLAAAIGAVENPADRLRLAVEAMGNTGKQVVGAMRTDIETLGSSTVKMSDEAIAGLNALDAVWKNLKTSIKAAVGEAAAAVVVPKGFASPAPGHEDASDAMRRAGLADGLPAVAAGAAEAAQALEWYRASVIGAATALPPIVASVEDLTGGLAEQIQASKDAEAAARAAVAEEKAHAGAMIELHAAGVGWQGTLDTINGDVVAGVQYYLDAGVAQGTLATAYGLTAVQVKAIATAMQEETRARDANNKTILDEIAAWAASQTAIAEHDRQVLQSDTTTRAHYEKLAADAAAAFAFAAAHGEEYTAARLAQLQTESEAADEALRNWSATAAVELTTVQGTAGATAAALDTVVSAFDRVSMAARGSAAAPTGGGGGLGSIAADAPSLALAALFPGSMLGFGQPSRPAGQSAANALWGANSAGVAAIAPTLASGMTVNATFNYPIMNDPAALDAIARLVGDAVMAKTTRSGTLV